MPIHLCCTVFVWILLQLICFIPISMNNARLEEFESHRKFRPKIQMYFPQNQKYQLSYDSVYNIKWKNCNFIQPRRAQMELLFRNIVNAVGLEAAKTNLVPTFSKEGFENVGNTEKSIRLFKTPFSFRKIREYAVDLNNKITIYIRKVTSISMYSNLLIEKIANNRLINGIRRNNNSRSPVTRQRILKDLSSPLFRKVHTPLFSSGLWKVDVQIFVHNEYKQRFLSVITVSNGHINSRNDRTSRHARNNLKQRSNGPRDNFAAKNRNSRKNRFLLSVNSDVNSEQEKGFINTSQEARYAGNKRDRSTSNQRDSPNEGRYASKIKRRWKRRSHRRLAKDSTFAGAAKRAKPSRRADATTKRALRISFLPDNNEADYRREIDRQIETDFAKIKDTLRLEKSDAISRGTESGWSSNTAKNHRRLVSQQPAAIDNHEPEIITARRVCTAPRCQQVIRAKSRDSNELPANSRDNVATDERRNEIAVLAAPSPPPSGKVVYEKIQQQLGNDDRKLVGEALIILNKNASPFSIVEKSNEDGVNLKYSVESISLGLDELLKIGEEAMKKELDKATRQNETKGGVSLSSKNGLKYARGNNETYRGLEDDEGTRLEEQLKELRNMNMQRGRGFANSGKNEMRFAAVGDEYAFRKDEAARLKSEYSSGHAKRARKRCRYRKHKSPRAANVSDKNSKLTHHGLSRRKKMQHHSPKFHDDVPFSYELVHARRPSRVKKNDPYKEYEESGMEEDLLPDTKAVEYSRNKRKAPRETSSTCNYEDAAERTIQTPDNFYAKKRESSNGLTKSGISRERVDTHSRQKIHESQSSSANSLMNKPQSQVKKKNMTHTQSFRNRKLKSIETDGILYETIDASNSDTLSRDIGNINYYDYEVPIISLVEVVENKYAKTNGPRRKLLSSSSMECDEESRISANEESNYDYAKKFYGDRPYEKPPGQLHYSQINLRNVMLSANVGKVRRASRIELPQCPVNKSMKTISKIGYSKRTLKSVEQAEHSDYSVKEDPMKNLYLSGDLIGYDYDPEEDDSKEKFQREIDVNEDPDLAKLFANGREYDINVRGKLHLRLKNPESEVAKSSKKKRSPGAKIEKSRKKHRAERKFAVPDKRSKRNHQEEEEEEKEEEEVEEKEDSTDVHKEDGNPESKVSNKTRNPLKKIRDFFERKFNGIIEKKKSRKKIHAKAKVVRLQPEQDYGQSTLPPSSDRPAAILETRRGDCNCARETTTLSSEFTDTTVPTDSAPPIKPSESADSNYQVHTMPDICHCRERSTETGPTITHATPHCATNRPAIDYSNTKAQSTHEVVSEVSPVTTANRPVIPSDLKNSESGPEQTAKVKNVMEILNFIKKLEKLLEDQKVPFRIADENGGVEIKLEKIYMHPGKNQSVAELKDTWEKDQKENESDEDDTSEVIHQSDNQEISSSPNENGQSFSQQSNENVFNDELDQSSKLLSNVNGENEMSEKYNFDEASQTIREPKKYENAILETYIEASVPKSSQVDGKNAANNKSLPAKQWINEQRIASNDQSSSRGRDSTLSDRKRKKRRRKKGQHRLRKRTVNGTGIVSKKGKAPYRLRRRRRRQRRRRLSRTIEP